MRKLLLRIGDEIRGPLTEDEIAALISEGIVTADTPCAPEGSEEWVPLSQQFVFYGALKINWGKKETTDERTRSPIHPNTRRLLLIYRLADAATVDMFTQEQAMRAIAEHAKRIRRKGLLHQTVGVIVFTLSIAVGTFLGLSPGTVENWVVSVARKVIKDEVDPKGNLRKLRLEFAEFEAAKSRTMKAIFEKPKGGILASKVVSSQQGPDQKLAYSLRGTVNFTPLNLKLASVRIGPDSDRRVVVLRKTPQKRLSDLIDYQSAALDELFNEKLDEATFEMMFEKLIPNLPDDNSLEARNLRLQAAGMTMSGYKSFVFSVHACAQAAALNPTKKAWGTNLLLFEEQLKPLLSKVTANPSPESCRSKWNAYYAERGVELAAWIKASAVKEVQINEDGSFLVEGIPDLDAATSNQVLISTHFNGNQVFLPWNSKYLGVGKASKEAIVSTLPEQRKYYTAIGYHVVDKTVVGGKTYYAFLKTPTHTFSIPRTAPKWYYVAIARKGDAKNLYALVDPRTYLSVQKGAPAETIGLTSLELYEKPMESERPEGLYEK